ncbi:sugar phosphate isomerase/epimerase family protein [Paenibacillus sp. GCM10023252]|uniref:sugar phosphate isomerase/epimerase family protein n=1 Tax=Paenibacillus sp. GCM10023252 TaxID=3252649 RepID=UPI00360E14FF
MQLGISTYTLTWSFGVPGYEKPMNDYTLHDLIAAARERGLTLIQIGDNVPLQHWSDAELAELKLAADDAGVTIELGTRGTETALLRKYLELAVRLDSSLVRTLITAPHLEEAERDLQAIAAEYETHGVRLAIENHGLHTTAQLVQLFSSLNSPVIACCLDTVNSFGALEGPEQVIHALMPYTVNLHIKDFDIQRVDHMMGFTVLGTPAGAGRLHIPELLQQLRATGREATAILELWTPYTRSVEETIQLEQQWMEQSLDYLKELMT